MGKTGIIIFREYWTRIRKRSFLLTTLLAPLGFAMFFIVAIFVSDYTDGEKVIAVIDESGKFDFRQKSLKTPADKSVYFKFPEQEYNELKDSLEKYNFDAVVKIPKNFDPEKPNKYQIQVYSSKRLGSKTKEAVDRAFSDQVTHLKMRYLEIDRALIDELNEETNITYSIVGEEDEKEGFAAIAAALGMVMGFAIYLSLFIYGTMVMKGVMEEKTNRIVEVVISSVKPFQLLLAKIIGIGAVGITQYFLWGILIFIVQLLLGLLFGSKIGEMPLFMPSGAGGNIDPMESQEMIASIIEEFNFWKIGFMFIFYYLGGYLLYGALFAAIGSATNDDGDLQSLTFPVTIPIVISFFFLIAVIQDPDGNLAFWTSIIPLTSPIIMPARIAFDPPLFHIILSMVLLIGGFIGTTWLAAKIYRTGILMYGKKISLRELAKWVIHSN